ncbi:MAG: sulfotransferase family 2 domain-containing protein [Cyanobium sp.]|jgi:hypothetical protein
MSNFLLRDPDCVFIHIPKTGGSSIRNGLWLSRYEGPVFGHIPSTWDSMFKFAFVRHPLDRLVSAWADFYQLRKCHLSFDEFMTIVLDETIIFDERRKTFKEKIRHHTIPQTHQFNCLFVANFIGRFESFEHDILNICSQLSFPMAAIPRLRQTQHSIWSHHLNGPTLSKAIAFYEQDFYKLGYALP